MNIILNLFTELLQCIFSFTGDWGIAVIIFTLLVKFVLSPLSFKQKISIFKQQGVQSKIEKIKAEYKNDNKGSGSHRTVFYIFKCIFFCRRCNLQGIF